MLLVEHVLDDIELGPNRWRISCCAVTLQSCKHVQCILMLALSDKQTWGVWEERAKGVNAKRKD